MLFGEMDSDSLDNIEDYDDGDEDQQQLQSVAGGVGAAASFTLFGSGDSPSDGVVFGGNRGAAATEASGAGAARGRAPASVPASSWLAGSQRQQAGRQQQQGGSGMLVDDDDLARQVAAQMARHRNKRMRASQSRSQMA
jgi:hypothetical protein